MTCRKTYWTACLPLLNMMRAIPGIFCALETGGVSMRRYQVNLLVDNSDLNHAPVIMENNPTLF